MEEVWKTIEGFKKYQISNLARVKSLCSTLLGEEMILKQQVSKNGYCSIIIRRDNKKRRFLVHRLVGIYFIPNPLNKKCINHKNGIRSDNRIENLEWSTHSENSQHGFTENGRKSERRFLTEDQVRDIKKKLLLYPKGITVFEVLAEKYQVPTYVIKNIKYNNTYKLI